MYYSLVSLLAIALHMIINHDVLWGNDGSDLIRAHKQYRIFLFSVLAFYTTDLLWGILDELRWTVGEYADTVVFFIAMMVSAVFWMRYIIAYIGETNKFSRLLTGVGIAMIVLQVAVLIVNFFVPVMFWFDADGAYQMGVARYLTLILQTLLFLMTSVYVLVVTKRTKQAAKRLKLSVGLFGVSMVILIFIQLFFPLMPLNSVGYLLAACLFHTFLVEDEKDEYRRKLEKMLEKERQQERELGSVKEKIYTDALTGAGNKLAYLEDEERINERIRSNGPSDWGVAVFDLNDLKKINDTKGHKTGDISIFNACMLIQEYFAHSPVYRIGGDEFAVILEGHDFRERVELLSSFNKQAEDNLQTGRIVVASGMSVFRPEEDRSFRSVFERADRMMYRRKAQLKALVKQQK